MSIKIICFSASSVIRWAAKTFSNSVFVMYEQVSIIKLNMKKKYDVFIRGAHEKHQFESTILSFFSKLQAKYSQLEEKKKENVK